FLTRRDRRAQAISFYRAKATKHWVHLAGEAPPDPAADPPFDAKAILDLEAFLQREEALWERYFRVRQIEPLRMEYETLDADYRGEVARALAFLELDAAAAHRLPPPRLQRQADALTDNWRARLDRVAPATPPKRRTMRTSIVIAEHFYADPEAVRAY